MKRIRQFTIARPGVPSDEKHLESWHKSWDCAVDELQRLVGTKDGEPIIEILDGQTNILVARFSTTDEQAIQQEQGLKPRLEKSEFKWETRPLPTQGGNGNPCECADGPVKFYANLNISDVYWTWVDGARLEIPVRMSFVQRQASRSPNGVWAFGSGILNECRDWLRR